MRSSIILGIILLGLGLLLFYMNNYDWELMFVYGALSGAGLGLIVGSLLGYFGKSRAIEKERKQEELKGLQIEKEVLESQASQILENQPMVTQEQQINDLK